MSEQLFSAEKSRDSYEGARHTVKFHGQGGEYFKIWIVNLLLSIVTLGIYSAWATVRRKRYFYGNTELGADRFDYHAKPVQILIGRIVAVAVLILYVVASAIEPIISGLIILGFLLALPWIIMRSWRFDAIMTSYRGLRFNYQCHYGKAYWVMMLLPLLVYVGAYLAILAVGFVLMKVLGPILGVILAALIGIAAFIFVGAIVSKANNELFFNRSQYGLHSFSVNLDKRALVKIQAVTILIGVAFFVLSGLIMLSLFQDIGAAVIAGRDPNYVAASHIGSIMFGYLIIFIGILVAGTYHFAATRNYVFNNLTFGELRFNSTMATGSVLLLMFTNMIIIICTLGLASPVAHVRLARYFADNTQAIGDLSLKDIRAHAEQPNSAIAGEMLQAFDIQV